MNRRKFLKNVAGGTAAISVAGGFIFAADKGKTPPNIVLVMADDQGWGDMAYYGHPKLITPNFDKMAAETFRFDHFYAAHPNCSPTRGSILTGRHPNRYGIFTPGLPIRPQEITFAQELKRAGYTTGHFGKWHLGSVFKGSPVNPSALGFDEWWSSPNFYDNDPIFSNRGIAVQMQGESSMVAADAAIEFMRKNAASGKPFLALVWFGSPHVPSTASVDMAALYPNERGKDKGGQRDWLGEISGMDAAFGKLRNEISVMGIRDNTIFWYISDNGGLFESSSGGRGKKGSIYEGGLRVPALFEWPGRFPGHRVIDMPCNTVDMYPTLLEAAGITSQNKRPMDGISLVPLLEGRMKERPRAMGFWEFGTRGQRTDSAGIMAQLLALQKDGKDVGDDPKLADQMRTDASDLKTDYPDDMFAGGRGGYAAWLEWPWKLHRIQEQTGTGSKFELYNLVDDPMESRNVIDRHPERAEAMKTALETWRKSVVNSLNGNDYK